MFLPTIILTKAPEANISSFQYLQLHINQASRRLAILTRRQGPTDDDLLANLERRIDSIEGLSLSERPSLEKRYNRVGVPKQTKASPDLVNTGTVPRTGNGKNKGPKHPKAQGAGGNPSKTNGNSTQPSTGNGGGKAASNRTLANGVTLANPPTANDSLGLDIEQVDLFVFIFRGILNLLSELRMQGISLQFS